MTAAIYGNWTGRPGLLRGAGIALGLLIVSATYLAPAQQGMRTVLQDPAARAAEEKLVAEIYKKILATSKEKTEADMKIYEVDIFAPGRVPKWQDSMPPRSFSMMPVKGGSFKMGSPETEPKTQRLRRPPAYGPGGSLLDAAMRSHMERV